SGRWQKYGPRNSSGKATSAAPERAASATPASARPRLSRGTPPQRICTRPSVTPRAVLIEDTPEGSRGLQQRVVDRLHPRAELLLQGVAHLGVLGVVVEVLQLPRVVLEVVQLAEPLTPVVADELPLVGARHAHEVLAAVVQVVLAEE